MNTLLISSMASRSPKIKLSARVKHLIFRTFGYLSHMVVRSNLQFAAPSVMMDRTRLGPMALIIAESFSVRKLAVADWLLRSMTKLKMFHRPESNDNSANAFAFPGCPSVNCNVKNFCFFLIFFCIESVYSLTTSVRFDVNSTCSAICMPHHRCGSTKPSLGKQDDQEKKNGTPAPTMNSAVIWVATSLSKAFHAILESRASAVARRFTKVTPGYSIQ